MLVGCAFVAGVVGDFKPNTLGVVMGLLAALSFTIYNIFTKIAAKRGIEPFSSMIYIFMFAAICALIICKPWEIPSLIVKNPLVTAPLIIGNGLITGLSPYLIYSISLKHLPVGVASAMSIIEPMTGAVLGALVYHDSFTQYTIFGMVLIIGSVFLLGMSEPKNKKDMASVNADANKP